MNSETAQWCAISLLVGVVLMALVSGKQSGSQDLTPYAKLDEVNKAFELVSKELTKLVHDVDKLKVVYPTPTPKM